jgi:hypothetical protein
MPVELVVEGFDNLLAALDRIKDPAIADVYLSQIGQTVTGAMMNYPGANAGNNEGNSRWYRRGVGNMWRRKGGSAGGPSTGWESGNMKLQWTSQSLGHAIEIANNAATSKGGPYAAYVHGSGGPTGQQQTWFHAEHGWPTLQGTIESRMPELIRAVMDEIARRWSGK